MSNPLIDELRKAALSLLHAQETITILRARKAELADELVDTKLQLQRAQAIICAVRIALPSIQRPKNPG